MPKSYAKAPHDDRAARSAQLDAHHASQSQKSIPHPKRPHCYFLLE
jgi:hypothetical protein